MDHFYNLGITSGTQKLALKLDEILASHLLINLESQIKRYGKLLLVLA